MKQVLIFIFILVFTNTVHAQDTLAHLEESWKEIETQLQRRNDVATVLLSELTELKAADSSLWKSTKNAAADLTNYIAATKSFDTAVIEHVRQMNLTLTSFLGRTLVNLENYPVLRQKEVVQNLMTHLMGTENRIAVAKRRHNELCQVYHRKEFIFEYVN